MGIVVSILFTALVSVSAVLFAANLAVVVLRLSHRPTQAYRVMSGVTPLAAYLRLGSGTRGGHGRSKHA